MHLVQILLPLYDNERQPFPPEAYDGVRRTLTERFGGLTVFHREPAEGVWRPSENHTTRDDLAIFEVMVTELETAWWSQYRRELEEQFRQDVIMIRAHQTQLL
ncbi:MAG: hypothetical protein ABI883_00910 [Chthoniobacterales bacterium]